MGNLNKAPRWALFFQIYDVRYPDLLVEVEFYIVSHHFPDDFDKFAGTMPKGVIVRTAFSHLGIIISFEKVALFLTPL